MRPDFVRNTISIGTVTSYDKQLMQDDGILMVTANINGNEESVLIWDDWGISGIPYIVGAEVLAWSVLALSEVKIGKLRNALYAPLNVKEGDKVIYNKVCKIYLDNSGDINVTTSNLNVTGPVNTTASYSVDGTKVVSNQVAAIADPTGGATIDSQVRAIVISMLNAMRSHGLIAT